MATVTLEGISKYFGPVPAVQELSCTIAQGEFLALLGPSGCGKTTTLLKIPRFSKALVTSCDPATIILLEPLGREVLLSVTCGPHPLKVLVPAPCHLAPETPVWLNLSQGPHHFFDPYTGVALVQR